MKEKISIIIPVYNERKYLYQCVNSILTQTWDNLEVILVDDGSESDVAMQCDRLEAEDDRIHVIHKKNEGIALAREAGMAAARGKWLTFIDADDCMDGKYALERLAECAGQTGADITVGNFRKIQGDIVTEKKEQHFFELEDQSDVKFRFCGFIRDGHLAYVWGKLYRTDFVRKNGIYHVPYQMIEDKIFNMKCCLAGAKYAFIDVSVYQYRVNSGSITFSYKRNLEDVWISSAKEFDTLERNLPQEKQLDDLCATHLLLGMYYFCKQEIQEKRMTPEEIRGKMKKYMNDPIVEKYARSYRNKHYGRRFGSLAWKAFFDVLAFLVANKLSSNAYSLFWFLLRFQMEKKVSIRRYRKAGSCF